MREGNKAVWIIDAIRPDGSDDGVETHLATGQHATIGLMRGEKRKREVGTMEQNDDAAPSEKEEAFTG